MPVDEDVNLDNPDGITEEDIRLMEQQADELEEIAKRAEEAKEKLDESGFNKLNFAQMNILEGFASTRSNDSNGGIGNMSTEQLAKLVVELLEKTEKAKEERIINKKAIDDAKKERDDIIRQVRSMQSEVGSGFNEFMNMKNNPIGFGKNKAMSIIGKAGLYGVIATFIIQMGQQVYDQVFDEIKKAFKAGGIFDVRKDVLNELKHISNLNHMVAVEHGEIFFTNDTAELLRQGVPQTSNIREKVNGHKQYLQEFDR